MFRIRLSTQLLEAMTLAAIEAYCYGEKPGRKWKPVETLGYIWGFKKVDPNEIVLFLDRMSLSISARRGSGSVDPNPEAQRLKNEVVSRWSPHLSLLGDFHSHAYRDLTAVKEVVGYEFSEIDFSSFLKDDLIWAQSGSNPAMLAITICRMGRVRESFGNRVRNNVCHYAVGEFGFWINAAAGYLDEAGVRRHTGNKNSKAVLDIELWPYNAARGRVILE